MLCVKIISSTGAISTNRRLCGIFVHGRGGAGRSSVPWAEVAPFAAEIGVLSDGSSAPLYIYRVYGLGSVVGFREFRGQGVCAFREFRT